MSDPPGLTRLLESLQASDDRAGDTPSAYGSDTILECVSRLRDFELRTTLSLPSSPRLRSRSSRSGDRRGSGQVSFRHENTAALFFALALPTRNRAYFLGASVAHTQPRRAPKSFPIAALHGSRPSSRSDAPHRRRDDGGCVSFRAERKQPPTPVSAKRRPAGLARALSTAFPGEQRSAATRRVEDAPSARCADPGSRGAGLRAMPMGRDPGSAGCFASSAGCFASLRPGTRVEVPARKPDHAKRRPKTTTTAVIPAFIAGTHRATIARARGRMGPGNKCRDDTEGRKRLVTIYTFARETALNSYLFLCSRLSLPSSGGKKY